MRKDFFGTHKTPLQSVYFGGGTPSLLHQDEFERIWKSLDNHFNLSTVTEVTLEANPDDMDEVFFDFIRSSPVNRLSVGVQSFDDEDLKYLHRVHDGQKARDSIEQAFASGIEFISSDLIFGIPTSGIDRLQKDVHILKDLGVQHISIYGLTIEPKTPLEYLIKHRKVAGIEDDKISEEMLWVMNYLPKLGYHQYEISNFAQLGAEAVHNSSYWHEVSYLGIGPSAHSYHQHVRSWNVSNNSRYIRAIQEGALLYESENIDMKTRYNEWIITKIRLREGINFQAFIQEFGSDYFEHLQKAVQLFLKNGDILQDKNTYKLSISGRLIADRISLELMM